LVEDPKHPALYWSELQPILESAVYDVLLILDCCYAAAAITKGSGGKMEVLAGCARERKADGPNSRHSIRSPFTDTLIRHLHEQRMRQSRLYVSELEVSMAMDRVLEKQSPIRRVIKGHHNPILLEPLNLTESILAWPPSELERRALLSVNFRGQTLPDMEDFVLWLKTLRPPEVCGIRIQNMEIEASFDSDSTLMLLSMPIRLWASFQEAPGCSLVGFIKSKNNLLKPDNDFRKVR